MGHEAGCRSHLVEPAAGPARRLRRGWRRRWRQPTPGRQPAARNHLPRNGERRGERHRHDLSGDRHRPRRQSADLLAVRRRRPDVLHDHGGRGAQLRPESRFRVSGRCRREQRLRRPAGGQRRQCERDAQPRRHGHECGAGQFPGRAGRDGLFLAALSHRRSGRLGAGVRRRAGRPNPDSQSGHGRDRGDTFPRRQRPDRNRWRARPARLRARAELHDVADLLRVPDRARRADPDPPLSNFGRQSQPGRSRHWRHHPRHRSPLEQPQWRLARIRAGRDALCRDRRRRRRGRSGQQWAEYERAARQAAADRSERRRFPVRYLARLSHSGRQPVRKRRGRASGNLGLWSSQPIPQRLRSAHPESVDRGCRPRARARKST